MEGYQNTNLEENIDHSFEFDPDEEVCQQVLSQAQRRKSTRKSLLPSIPDASVTTPHSSSFVVQKRPKIDQNVYLQTFCDLDLVKSLEGKEKSTSTPKRNENSFSVISPKRSCFKSVQELHHYVTKNDVIEVNTQSNNSLKGAHSDQKIYENMVKGMSTSLEAPLGSANEEFSAEQLIEKYRQEAREWDKLIKFYEDRLNSVDSQMSLPSEEWIEKDPVVSRYKKVVDAYSSNRTGKYLGIYDSLDQVSISISDLSDNILFELERLPLLLNRQTLFIRSLQKKLKMKENMKCCSYFEQQSSFSLFSEFVKMSP